MIGITDMKKIKEKPIVFKDGKKVDFSSVNDQWIDGDILEEEMQYISKMTEGLSTGTMSSDKEYILLKNKVVKEMIDDKVISLKKRLCEMAKKKSSIYDHASIIQDQALQRVQDYAKQVAKDNSTEIYLDELTGEYKINRSPKPVSLRHNVSNGRSYKWHTIDAKRLKKEILERETEILEREEVLREIEKQSAIDDKILKEVQEKLAAQKKNGKKKKAVKKTIKKKVVKKKVTKNKVKKNDRK